MKQDYPLPVPMLIGQVISQVSAALLPQLQAAESSIQSINYMYDTYVNIERRLLDKARNPGVNGIGGKFDLMPMVCLIMPFPESYGANGGYWQTVDLNVIMCYYTERDWTTEERYQNRYLPILLPLYQSFIEKLADSGLFTDMSYKNIRHKKYDLPFWGDRDAKGNSRANIFSNFLDAIEIQNLSLTVADPPNKNHTRR